MAAPNGAPPVTCADGQIRLSQGAVDMLNGQKTLNPDVSQQNLSLLAAEAAARCGQMESTQHVVETEAGGIAVVSSMSPKDLWDTLSHMLNHDQAAPRGNKIVEPPTDAAADGGSVGLTSGVALADDAARDTPVVAAPSATTPRASPSEVQAWADTLPSTPSRSTTVSDLYEITQTGPDNYLTTGGGEKVNADGVRPADAHLLEAKYTGNPDRSPFVEGSACPDFVREDIRAKEDDQFRRYAAVLGDPSNPVGELEVITNDQRAIPYFQALLDKYQIKGRIVVRP